MTAWLDRKYILLVSNRLESFKQKSENLYNCKCPICGDSKTSKAKKRLYFYLKSNDFRVFCHNCGFNSSVKYFLKRMDLGLYQQYRLEELKNRNETVSPHFISFKHDNSDYMEQLRELKKISQLSYNHPAKLYIESRKIPNLYHSVLRWTPEFMKWTNGLIPEKFTARNLGLDEGRIVIPFFSKENKFFAYTGRSLNDSYRYILIVLDKSLPLLFGLNNLNLTRKILVVEGPIDSMFLDNCIAMSGSNIGDLTKVAERDRFVIIFDNEPHKAEAKSKIFSAIENGFKVCIFPSWVEYKDINTMILAGWNPGYIQELIEDNSYSGLTAKIKLQERYCNG